MTKTTKVTPCDINGRLFYLWDVRSNGYTVAWGYSRTILGAKIATWWNGRIWR